MKRFFASLMAVLLLVAGIGLAGLGTLGIAVFGTDGKYQAPASELTSAKASVAIIADLAGVEVGIPYHDRLGEVTISVRPAKTGAVFLASGAQQDVDRYLFGQPYDLATKDSSWQRVAVPGVETTIAAPEDQEFWVAQAAGSTATIPLEQGNQQQTLVIMNVDGSPGVAVQAWLGFAGERIFPGSAAALGIGLILIILAVAILVRVVRRRSRPERIIVVEESVVDPIAQPSNGTLGPKPAADTGTAPVEPTASDEPAPAQADRAPS